MSFCRDVRWCRWCDSGGVTGCGLRPLLRGGSANVSPVRG